MSVWQLATTVAAILVLPIRHSGGFIFVAGSNIFNKGPFSLSEKNARKVFTGFTQSLTTSNSYINFIIKPRYYKQLHVAEYCTFLHLLQRLRNP